MNLPPKSPSKWVDKLPSSGPTIIPHAHYDGDHTHSLGEWCYEIEARLAKLEGKE